MGIDIIAHSEAITSLKAVTSPEGLLAVLVEHGPIIAAPMPGVRIVPEEIELLPDDQAMSLAYSLAYGLQNVLNRNFPAVEEAYKLALEYIGHSAVVGSASQADHNSLLDRVSIAEAELAILKSQMVQSLSDSQSALDTVTDLDATSESHESRITSLETA